MDIVIIGSGNVATVLGRKALLAKHRILQVYSPDSDHANRLAMRLGTQSTSYISAIEKNADLILFAVKDDILSELIRNFGGTRSLLAHTAGSVSIDIFNNVSTSYGVVYPLQSLRKEIDPIPPIPLLIDGNNSESLSRIRNFALSIAGPVTEAGDEPRLKYHLAATIVNNFSNYLFSLASAFCEKENISFQLLQPLMEETVDRLQNHRPSTVQTGPAIRKDLATIEKHRALLTEIPELARFYDLFTDAIRQSGSAVKL